MIGPPVQAEVLGKLLVISGALSILPDQEAMGAFMGKALSRVPGVAAIGFCLRGVIGEAPPQFHATCSRCRAEWDRSYGLAVQCGLEQHAAMRCFPLRTASTLYGFLLGTIEDADEFLPYEPHIANLANSMASELERRVTQGRLRQALQDLESQVADRTAELAQRNAELEGEIQSRNALDKALRRSEERYRSLTIASAQIVWTTDSEGEVVDDLPGWRAFTGQNEAEIKGRGWCNAVHPQDRQRTLAIWSRTVASRAIYDTEYRLRRHDGEFRHIAARGVPVWEADGSIREWVGTCTDISERKQAEAALQKSHAELEARVRERTAALEQANQAQRKEIEERQRIEAAMTISTERLQSIMRTAGDGIIVIDAQGTIEDFNPAAERLFGYRTEDILGEDVGRLIPRLQREQYDRSLPPTPAAGDDQTIGTTMEASGCRENGSTFPTEITISEMTIDGQRKFTGIIHDTTGRKRAEARIRQSEAFVRSVLDSLSTFVAVLTTDGTLIEVNQAPLQAAGIGTAEVYGKKFWECYWWGHSAEAQQQLRIAIEQAAGGQASRYDSDFRVAGGELMPVDLMLAPLRNEEGQITHLIPSAIPITERKRMEQALRETDRRKDEFLAMLAHELRNPLAPIRHAVQVLRAPGNTDTKLAWGHDLIDRQVVHMARLLDDLLDVARIMQGKIRLKIEPIDIVEIIRRALESCRPEIEAREHAITVALPAQPHWLEGDATRLEQVLTNLLNNAAKYTRPGGRITLSMAAEGSWVAIRVKDTGIGIDPALLPHVFDIFTQADRSLAHSQGGLGLGLTLVQRLVELHQGSVGVTSAGIDHGSEFTLRLPLAAAGQAAAETPIGAARAQALPAPSGLRILVVDDYADAVESLALLLQASGYAVDTADCGAKALERAALFRPQAVLLDIGLPDLDGYEVAQRLRALPETRQAVLIAVTGYGQPADRKRALTAGFDHHLLKPMDPEGLFALLASVPVNRQPL